jgi:hypothetical protein
VEAPMALDAPPFAKLATLNAPPEITVAPV